MTIERVKKYLNGSVTTPFFLVVGDASYTSVKTELFGIGLSFLKVSDYCGDADKRPNLDKLIGAFTSVNEDNNKQLKKIVVVGLGEYLALCGKEEARNWLSKLKDIHIGDSRVVLLLRGVYSQVHSLQLSDSPRFDDRRVCFTEDTVSAITINIISNEGIPNKKGVKGLLQGLEEGETTIDVSTSITFDTPLAQVNHLNTAYECILYKYPTFPNYIRESLGTQEQWKELLAALSSENGSLEKIMAKYGSRPEDSLSKWINGNSYKHWLYFITLKIKVSNINNAYLKYVVEITDTFTNLRNNILTAIVDISHSDKRFDYYSYYSVRKTLDKDFTMADIEMFIDENKRDLNESLYKLTNLTLRERQEFIALFEHLNPQTLLSRAKETYPYLYHYLQRYTFTNADANNALFTEYFHSYKWQKVKNKLEDDFHQQVKKLAVKPVHNRLPSRDEIIKAVDKERTLLYWIDALGVEYLAFIQNLCKDMGLTIKIHTARANLPTITSANNDFFYNGYFKEPDCCKEDNLDEQKHKETSKYKYKTGEHPHLAEELDTISNVLNEINSTLNKGVYTRVLIASDHGASRLAVICEQTEKYEVEEENKGKHGGRCRKRSPDFHPTADDMPYATESDDGQFIVLANYGRFKGSRMSCVEVHGGASLEEVLVPVIEVSLGYPVCPIELQNGDNLVASFRRPLEFTLYTKAKLRGVSVVIDSNCYYPKKDGQNHHHFTTDIKKAGIYHAEVFIGDNLIDKIELNVRSETEKPQKKGSPDDIL